MWHCHFIAPACTVRDPGALNKQGALKKQTLWYVNCLCLAIHGGLQWNSEWRRYLCLLQFLSPHYTDEQNISSLDESEDSETGNNSFLNCPRWVMVLYCSCMIHYGLVVATFSGSDIVNQK